MKLVENLKNAVKNVHFWVHVILFLIACMSVSRSGWDSTCSWLDWPTWYVLENHDISAFNAVELGIIILWILGDPPKKKLIVSFDIAGAVLCLGIGILQILGKWVHLGGYDSKIDYKCDFNIPGLINVVAALIYLFDLLTLDKWSS